MTLLPRALALLALAIPGSALATAGYFQLGYGLKSKGMGGVGIALPQDALAGAMNPAGMAWVGNRADAGVELFIADRGAEITPGNTLNLSGNRDANGRKAFIVPDFGINRMFGNGHSMGLTVVGNGGMTRYRDNPLQNLDGSNPGGMELARIMVAPALALRLSERHSVGVSLNFVYQEFAARGIEHFDDPFFTIHRGFVTNRGRDASFGVGARIGWLGRVTDSLTLGATWQPRIRMSRFESYKGLFKDGGRFNAPEDFGAGLSLRATPALIFAADIQRINFADGSTGCFLRRTCFLGAVDGPGSGWRNTTVYKLGVSWQGSPALTLRAGVALLRQPIPSGETLINMFSPAVSEKHLTLGATWAFARDWEATASFLYAVPNTVHGVNSIPPGFPPGGVGGAEANLRMKQVGLGLSLGLKM